VREPYVRMEMFTPTEFVGSLMDLAQTRRGQFKEVK
jgi:GTP-binding protein LepA